MKKITSLFLCFVLCAGQGVFPHSLPVSYAAGEKIDSKQGSFEIPVKLGSIQEVYRGSNQRTVILIQDAHSVPDAQRAICDVIRHLQSKADIRGLAIEGASGNIDLTFFRSFPDPQNLRKVFEGYLDSGELSGAVAAGVLGEKETEFFGLEDPGFYEDGVSAFLRALASKTALSALLNTYRRELEILKARVYSKQAFDLDGRFRDVFEKGNPADILTVLSKHRRPSGERFPHLAAMLDLLDAESPEKQKDLDRQIDQRAEKLRTQANDSTALAALNQKIQAWRTGAISRGEFAAYWVEQSGDTLPSDSRFQILAESAQKLRDLQGSVFFREFSDYREEVFDVILKSGEEKTLHAFEQNLERLEHLAELKLTTDEWGALKKQVRGKRRIQDPRSKIQKENRNLNADNSTDELETKFKEWLGEIAARYSDFVRFYELAERRDEVFISNIKKFFQKPQLLSRGAFSRVSGEGRLRTSDFELPDSNSLIVVTGGFHAEALKTALRREKISYVCILPRIDDVGERANYLSHMRGEVSWKGYFKAENGRIDLYDAFARATADRLLSEIEVGRKKSEEPIEQKQPFQLRTFNFQRLKLWRDNLIRTMAGRGDTAGAEKYTRLLDRMAFEHSDPGIKGQLKNKWSEKLEKFIRDLHGLEAGGSLKTENVLKLLGQNATIAWTAVPFGRVPAGWRSGNFMEGAASTVRAEIRGLEQDLNEKLIRLVLNDPDLDPAMKPYIGQLLALPKQFTLRGDVRLMHTQQDKQRRPIGLDSNPVLLAAFLEEIQRDPRSDASGYIKGVIVKEAGNLRVFQEFANVDTVHHTAGDRLLEYILAFPRGTVTSQTILQVPPGSNVHTLIRHFIASLIHIEVVSQEYQFEYLRKKGLFQPGRLQGMKMQPNAVLNRFFNLTVDPLEAEARVELGVKKYGFLKGYYQSMELLQPFLQVVLKTLQAIESQLEAPRLAAGAPVVQTSLGRHTNASMSFLLDSAIYDARPGTIPVINEPSREAAPREPAFSEPAGAVDSGGAVDIRNTLLIEGEESIARRLRKTVERLHRRIDLGYSDQSFLVDDSHHLTLRIIPFQPKGLGKLFAAPKISVDGNTITMPVTMKDLDTVDRDLDKLGPQLVRILDGYRPKPPAESGKVPANADSAQPGPEAPHTAEQEAIYQEFVRLYRSLASSTQFTEEQIVLGANREPRPFEWNGFWVDLITGAHGAPKTAEAVLESIRSIVRNPERWLVFFEGANRPENFGGETQLIEARLLWKLTRDLKLPVIDPLPEKGDEEVVERVCRQTGLPREEVMTAIFYDDLIFWFGMAERGRIAFEQIPSIVNYTRSRIHPDAMQLVVAQALKLRSSLGTQSPFAERVQANREEVNKARNAIARERLLAYGAEHGERTNILTVVGQLHAPIFGKPVVMPRRSPPVSGQMIGMVLRHLDQMGLLTGSVGFSASGIASTGGQPAAVTGRMIVEEAGLEQAADVIDAQRRLDGAVQSLRSRGRFPSRVLMMIQTGSNAELSIVNGLNAKEYRVPYKNTAEVARILDLILLVRSELRTEKEIFIQNQKTTDERQGGKILRRMILDQPGLKEEWFSKRLSLRDRLKLAEDRLAVRGQKEVDRKFAIAGVHFMDRYGIADIAPLTTAQTSDSGDMHFIPAVTEEDFRNSFELLSQIDDFLRATPKNRALIKALRDFKITLGVTHHAVMADGRHVGAVTFNPGASSAFMIIISVYDSGGKPRIHRNLERKDTLTGTNDRAFAALDRDLTHELAHVYLSHQRYHFALPVDVRNLDQFLRRNDIRVTVSEEAVQRDPQWMQKLPYLIAQHIYQGKIESLRPDTVKPEKGGKWSLPTAEVRRKFLTLFAATSVEDFWAESLSLFWLDPGYVRAKDPVLFDFLNAVTDWNGLGVRSEIRGSGKDGESVDGFSHFFESAYQEALRGQEAFTNLISPVDFSEPMTEIGLLPADPPRAEMRSGSELHGVLDEVNRFLGLRHPIVFSPEILERYRGFEVYYEPGTESVPSQRALGILRFVHPDHPKLSRDFLIKRPLSVLEAENSLDASRAGLGPETLFASEELIIEELLPSGYDLASRGLLLTGGEAARLGAKMAEAFYQMVSEGRVLYRAPEGHRSPHNHIFILNSASGHDDFDVRFVDWSRSFRGLQADREENQLEVLEQFAFVIKTYLAKPRQNILAWKAFYRRLIDLEQERAHEMKPRLPVSYGDIENGLIAKLYHRLVTHNVWDEQKESWKGFFAKVMETGLPGSTRVLYRREGKARRTVRAIVHARGQRALRLNIGHSGVSSRLAEMIISDLVRQGALGETLSVTWGNVAQFLRVFFGKKLGVEASEDLQERIGQEKSLAQGVSDVKELRRVIRQVLSEHGVPRFKTRAENFIQWLRSCEMSRIEIQTETLPGSSGIGREGTVVRVLKGLGTERRLLKQYMVKRVDHPEGIRKAMIASEQETGPRVIFPRVRRDAILAEDMNGGFIIREMLPRDRILREVNPAGFRFRQARGVLADSVAQKIYNMLDYKRLKKIFYPWERLTDENAFILDEDHGYEFYLVDWGEATELKTAESEIPGELLRMLTALKKQFSKFGPEFWTDFRNGLVHLARRNGVYADEIVRAFESLNRRMIAEILAEIRSGGSDGGINSAFDRLMDLWREIGWEEETVSDVMNLFLEIFAGTADAGLFSPLLRQKADETLTAMLIYNGNSNFETGVLKLLDAVEPLAFGNEKREKTAGILENVLRHNELARIEIWKDERHPLLKEQLLGKLGLPQKFEPVGVPYEDEAEYTRRIEGELKAKLIAEGAEIRYFVKTTAEDGQEQWVDSDELKPGQVADLNHKVPVAHMRKKDTGRYPRDLYEFFPSMENVVDIPGYTVGTHRSVFLDGKFAIKTAEGYSIHPFKTQLDFLCKEYALQRWTYGGAPFSTPYFILTGVNAGGYGDQNPILIEERGFSILNSLRRAFADNDLLRAKDIISNVAALLRFFYEVKEIPSQFDELVGSQGDVFVVDVLPHRFGGSVRAREHILGYLSSAVTDYWEMSGRPMDERQSEIAGMMTKWFNEAFEHPGRFAQYTRLMQTPDAQERFGMRTVLTPQTDVSDGDKNSEGLRSEIRAVEWLPDRFEAADLVRMTEFFLASDPEVQRALGENLPRGKKLFIYSGVEVNEPARVFSDRVKRVMVRYGLIDRSPEEPGYLMSLPRLILDPVPKPDRLSEFGEWSRLLSARKQYLRHQMGYLLVYRSGIWSEERFDNVAKTAYLIDESDASVPKPRRANQLLNALADESVVREQLAGGYEASVRNYLEMFVDPPLSFEADQSNDAMNILWRYALHYLRVVRTYREDQVPPLSLTGRVRFSEYLEKIGFDAYYRRLGLSASQRAEIERITDQVFDPQSLENRTWLEPSNFRRYFERLSLRLAALPFARNEMRERDQTAREILEGLFGLRMAQAGTVDALLAENPRAENLEHVLRDTWARGADDFVGMALTQGDFAMGGHFRFRDDLLSQKHIRLDEFQTVSDRQFDEALERLTRKIRCGEIGRMAPIIYYEPEMSGKLSRFIAGVYGAFEFRGSNIRESLRLSLVTVPKNKSPLLSLMKGIPRGAQNATDHYWVEDSDAGWKQLAETLGNRIAKSEKFAEHYGMFFMPAAFYRTLTAKVFSGKRAVDNAEVPEKETALTLLPDLAGYYGGTKTGDISPETLRHALPDEYFAAVAFGPGGGLRILAKLIEVIAAGYEKIVASA